MKILFIFMVVLSACSVQSEFNPRIRGRIGYDWRRKNDKILINHKLDLIEDNSIIYEYKTDIHVNSAAYKEVATGKFVGIVINEDDMLFITSEKGSDNTINVKSYDSVEQIDFSKINVKWGLVREEQEN